MRWWLPHTCKCTLHRQTVVGSQSSGCTGFLCAGSHTCQVCTEFTQNVQGYQVCTEFTQNVQGYQVCTEFTQNVQGYQVCTEFTQNVQGYQVCTEFTHNVQGYQVCTEFTQNVQGYQVCTEFTQNVQGYKLVANGVDRHLFYEFTLMSTERQNETVCIFYIPTSIYYIIIHFNIKSLTSHQPQISS